MSAYQTAFGVFPPGRLGTEEGYAINSNDVSGVSGFALLLPQLDQKSLYDRLDFQQKSVWHIVGGSYVFMSTSSGKAIGERPPAMVCPSDMSESSRNPQPWTWTVLAATGSYAMCEGTKGGNGLSYDSK